MHGLDAARWTAPRLLFDFGESSIDAHIMRSNDGGVHAVWKSEQNVCREFRWRADASRPPLWANRSCTLALRLAKDPRFTRLPAMRAGNTYADDDLVERVTTHRIYVVATCDKDLKRRIRKIAGVPLISIKERKYQVERMPEGQFG